MIIHRTIFSGLLILWLFATVSCAEPVLAETGEIPGVNLSQVLDAARKITAPGQRIVAISSRFVGMPYVAHTLIGGPAQPEQLMSDLSCFDCFTLLDTVEALRRSDKPADFPEMLAQVRYRQGQVGYETRHHFFSDWVAGPESPINDVTGLVGRDRTRVQVKQLNRKADGSLWLPGIPAVERDISFIPTERIDHEVLHSLQSGDYAGIYSDRAGLDVSHVGIIVIEDDRVLLRHASSRAETGKVVDEDLVTVLHDKPGLLVYRVRE